MGDIVFVQGKGIISRMIRLIDKGEFSHCAIAINNTKVVEANYDTKVAIRQFDKEEYNKVEVLDLGLTKEQRENVYIASMSHIGKRYDYISLLWYILRRIFSFKGKNVLNNPNNVICSELVFLVLDEVGILDELNIKDSFKRGIDLTPNELYDLVKYVSK